MNISSYRAMHIAQNVEDATDGAQDRIEHWLSAYFRAMRFDGAHHLGAGDIRLTLAQQEYIVRRLRGLNKPARKEARDDAAHRDALEDIRYD